MSVSNASDDPTPPEKIYTPDKRRIGEKYRIELSDRICPNKENRERDFAKSQTHFCMEVSIRRNIFSAMKQSTPVSRKVMRKTSTRYKQ